MKKSELYDLNSVELNECINNVKIDLKNNNIEYRDKFYKIERLKNKYPNIRNILEDEKICDITLKESKALLETINLYRDLLKLEQYEIFLLGNKECFEYLKKIKVV